MPSCTTLVDAAPRQLFSHAADVYGLLAGTLQQLVDRNGVPLP